MITTLVGSTSINSVISITSKRKCGSQKENEEREKERKRDKEKEREKENEKQNERASEREKENMCVCGTNEAEL